MKDVKHGTNSMDKAFGLSVTEIEKVLEGKKPITDITKLAANTVSNYSKIKASEVHEMGLILAEQKMRQKMLPES
jgi:hypothetical protein